ncbi:PREDICTED: uncharacterized protein LOC104754178 [Camelina sativa]|uniref:Uncharacterized protein LOC104754178 n=1 Tax=Camelina sativa TaxID=90675 RepID=A0ABM0WQ83_CAMSA|nr:PREDICTED: uncharacterized protein LOC104754178 [Camelina sativa]
MANSDWTIAYPSSRSEYLRFEGSDHRPLVISFDPVKRRRSGLFRYDRRLKGNDEVKKLVLEAWNCIPNASVDQRIHRYRTAIITWCKTQHSNSQKEIIALRELLEEAMSDNETPKPSIDSLNHRLLIAYKREEEFWKQRSRQLWLNLGDKNTGFFHAATKVYEEKDIVQVISNYFQDIFTSQAGDKTTVANEALSTCITEEMNSKLITIPNALEIKQACF